MFQDSKKDGNQELSTSYPQSQEPGGEYNRVSEYTVAIAKPINEIQVHNKTVRNLAVKYGNLHENNLEALAIVDTFLLLHGRKQGNRDHIIDWSGALTAWKRRVNKGIESAIGAGYMEQHGKTLLINELGMMVLDDYNTTFEEVRRMYENKGHSIRMRPKKKNKKEIL